MNIEDVRSFLRRIMKRKAIVWILECDLGVRQKYTEVLQDKVVFRFFGSSEGVVDAFKNDPWPDLLVTAYQANDGQMVQGIETVRSLHYHGTIIAGSCYAEENKALLAAGATVHARYDHLLGRVLDQGDIARLALEILGLTKKSQ